MKQVPCAVWEMQERQVSEQHPSCSGFSSPSYLLGFLALFHQLQILGRSIQGNQPSPASMPWVLEELGPKARALAEDLEIGVSMVSGGRTYVRVCVQVWVCVHGLLSLGSFAWEMEVVDGGRDVKFSATQ